MQKEVKTRIFTGKVKTHVGLQTAINKQAVSESIYLSEFGLKGDQCADEEHHGGLERALHHYPAEHYAYWQQKYGKAKQAWQIAGMGENISSLGLTEQNVCIGDQFQWGEAIIEVSQPRSPCFKLNKHWGLSRFAVAMQNSTRCGWLLRVIKPGMVTANAPLSLVRREANAMTIQQTCDIFFDPTINKTALQKLQKQSKLSNSWLEKIELRLSSGEIECWSFRLLGPV